MDYCLGLTSRIVMHAFAASPLLYACRMGHLEVVELLLSRGADPTICDHTGRTPLMMASNGGHVDVVRCLVRNKAVRATIDTLDRYEWTAL